MEDGSQMYDLCVFAKLENADFAVCKVSNYHSAPLVQGKSGKMSTSFDHDYYMNSFHIVGPSKLTWHPGSYGSY